jgi:transcriptional regulator with XRE-family HTH domain
MKSHREFVTEQCQDPAFAQAYAKARHEAAFAVSLARLREEQGLTQKALGERAGIRQPVLARYERGFLPNLANLQKIAGALNARILIQPDGEVLIQRA